MSNEFQMKVKAEGATRHGTWMEFEGNTVSEVRAEARRMGVESFVWETRNGKRGYVEVAS